MEKYIIENGIKYELCDDIYYPMLKLDEQTDYQIGKYGCLHLDYIKQHRKGRYNTLLVEAKLNTYLHEIDVQAHSMFDNIIANLAKERGIAEELKALDMLKWVAEMNNIKASAEEIALNKLIYQ
ncbi:MAG: TnpV protein [Ruminococcaceae bacterium]|nr:TnpV protein [Oscillospiraceae bacterium]